jgi:hypothetical protein
LIEATLLGASMTDLSRMLQGAQGDGVHWTSRNPVMARRSVRAADDEGLDYLSIHRCRGPLGVRSGRSGLAAMELPREEGGDPACWAHLFENNTKTAR